MTEYGMGPDKWATAWLLTRVMDPGAVLIVVHPGGRLPEGFPFDVPASKVRRIDDRAAFEVALDKLRGDGGVARTDDDLVELARLVHEIEVDFWNTDDSPAAVAVEDAFRSLQRRHGRSRVTPACYVAFFDAVHRALRSARERQEPLNRERLQLDCSELARSETNARELVPELSLSEVLGAIAAGKRVQFVDVREAEEFRESHIPGAINATLRDIDGPLRASLAGADHVISYCVKDFRGFEMAKALADAGVANSAIMKPYGIKGWISAGLPIASEKELSDAEASGALLRCAREPHTCTAAGGAHP